MAGQLIRIILIISLRPVIILSAVWGQLFCLLQGCSTCPHVMAPDGCQSCECGNESFSKVLCLYYVV